MPKKKSPPKYRRHKATGLAVVTIEGRDQYLGPFGSVESHEAFERKIAQWRQRRASNPGSPPSCDATNPTSAPLAPAATFFTVNEVILGYLGHAKTYYRKKNGAPAGELDNMRYALRAVKNLYGRMPAVRFDIEALEVVRLPMSESLGPSQSHRTNPRRNRQVGILMPPGAVPIRIRDDRGGQILR